MLPVTIEHRLRVLAYYHWLTGFQLVQDLIGLLKAVAELYDKGSLWTSILPESIGQQHY